MVSIFWIIWMVNVVALQLGKILFLTAREPFLINSLIDLKHVWQRAYPAFPTTCSSFCLCMMMSPAINRERGVHIYVLFPSSVFFIEPIQFQAVPKRETGRKRLCSVLFTFMQLYDIHFYSWIINGRTILLHPCMWLVN